MADSLINDFERAVPGQEVRQLPLQMDRNAIEDWNQGAADCVRSCIFAKQQFLVNDACLDMGSMIQKHVAKYIHVSSVERLRMFWEVNGGRETVRNTFRRKRQAAQNAMKIAFKGK